jgi:hypothetical protein
MLIKGRYGAVSVSWRWLLNHPWIDVTLHKAGLWSESEPEQFGNRATDMAGSHLPTA